MLKKLFLMCLGAMSVFAGDMQNECIRKPEPFPIRELSTNYPMLFKEMVVKEDGNIAVILSDGSEWVLRTNCQENLNQWQVGDDIRIIFLKISLGCELSGGDKFFILKNARTGQMINVDFDVSIKDSLDTYRIIKIDQNGYFITTCNGQDWTICVPDARVSAQWKIGDKILINRGDSAENGYWLINIDRLNGIRAIVTIWQ